MRRKNKLFFFIFVSILILGGHHSGWTQSSSSFTKNLEKYPTTPVAPKSYKNPQTSYPVASPTTQTINQNYPSAVPTPTPNNIFSKGPATGSMAIPMNQPNQPISSYDGLQSFAKPVKISTNPELEKKYQELYGRQGGQGEKGKKKKGMVDSLLQEIQDNIYLIILGVVVLITLTAMRKEKKWQKTVGEYMPVEEKKEETKTAVRDIWSDDF